MNSMDQAFVKAFARRNRSKQHHAGQNQQAVPASTDGHPSRSAVRESHPAPPAVSIDEPGALSVDQSVAQTAKVWVDPIEDQIARADDATIDVTRPHVEPPDDSQVTPPAGQPTAAAEPAAEPTNRVAADPIETSPSELASEKQTPWAETPDLFQHIHTAYASVLTEIPVMPETSGQPADTIRQVNSAPSTQVEVGVQPSRRVDPPARAATPAETATPLETATPAETATPVETATPAETAPLETSPADIAARVDVAPHASPAIHLDPAAAGRPAVSSADVRVGVMDGSGELTEVRVDPPVSSRMPRSLTPLHAAWEVDVFDVPTCVADLFFDGTLFQQIAERMSEAVSTGLSSVLITSTKPGEGRSSVAIGLAMASAAAGIRVAIVDGDTEHPSLADDLRLDLQYGWVDTIRGGLPIKEVAVHAVEDAVTLIPLMPPNGRNAATAFEVVQLIELLREKFELVIIDGPTGQSPHLHQCASVVDSALIVRDVTRTNNLAINEFSYRLRESGVQGVGVVENFT